MRSWLLSLVTNVEIGLVAIYMTARAPFVPASTIARITQQGCRRWVARAKPWAGIEVEWRGFDTLPQDRAFILLSKHMSYLDIYATFAKRPDMTALAKKQLFHIPFVGSVFRKLGIVSIDRGKGTAKDAMPAVIEKVIASKRCLVVYPEGTRTLPGERRKLKSGAYFLQEDGQLDVFPMATNSGCHWQKRKPRKYPGTVVFEIGEPFPKDLDKDAFMARTEKAVVERSEQLRTEFSPHTKDW